MEAPDRWLYEYSLVRYLPRPERGEFINIGLVMLCKRRKWLKGKVILNEEKLKLLNKAIDLSSLRQQVSIFERTDVPDPILPVEEKYRWLTAEKSACIRVSPSHPGLIMVEETSLNNSEERRNREEKAPEEILNSEFDRLFNNLVI